MAEPAPPPGFIPAETPEPAPPPGFVPAEDPGLLESFARGAAEGATFGFADELGMDKERLEASRRANPWTHFAGEFAGSLAPMVAAGFLPTGATQAAAAGRAASLLSKGANLVRGALVPGEIGTLGQAVKQGAKLGATYGGLSGAGHADVEEGDPLYDALEKRAKGAVVGAAQGAPAGAVLGGIGHGVYRGAQSLGNLKANAAAESAGTGKGALVTATKAFERDRITPDELIAQITSEFPDESAIASGGLARRYWGGMKNKQPITAEHVERVVRGAMAGETPAQISAALSPGGKGTGPGESAVRTLLDELAERHLGPLNLVDRTSMVRPGAGENTQMTMRAAAATPGEHLGVARENLLERQMGAQGRVQDLLSRMFGSSDFEGVVDQHKIGLQAAGQKAFGEALAKEQPFDLQPIIDKWTNQVIGKRGPVPEGILKALDDFQEKVPIRNMQTGMTVTNQLRPPQTLTDFINARQNIRQAIDAEKPGTPLFRNLTQFYNELTDAVGSTNPAWRAANNIWRDGKAAEEALEAGAKMSTRLNASNRESLSFLKDARKAEDAATTALSKASQAILGPKTRRLPDANELAAATPDQQAAYAQAQAMLEAAYSRQELFKVGLVRAIGDMLANQGDTHNLTRQLLLPGAKKLLSEVLGKDAEQFFRVVNAERAMHGTFKSQFGSQTTPLREAIDELNWAPQFEASWKNLGLGKVLQLAADYAARHLNASRNRDLMGIYTQTDPLAQIATLRAIQGLTAARSQAGNAAARPVIGAAAPLMETLQGAQASEQKTMAPYRP